MNILPYIIGPVLTVLVVSTVMSILYKDAEKKDKGFVLNYYRLTYRRRLIRAVWGVPIVSLLYLALYWFSDLTSNEYKIIGIIFLSIVLLDISYNYVKWKKNEKKR
ncbi:hypothetical protein [Sporosarcina koreensis]|uniref:hypothetical protein n=1 Tax=Bacillales TaxID=1385 RepID=UPI00075D8D9F|nr:hypothetical protein [Sporosarcina koreensis]